MKYFPALKYLNLPNLMTWVSFCLGIVSLLLFAQASYKPALVLYALPFLFDKLDGLMARRLGLASPFGAELDNLSDAINFAVVPALMAYGMGFNSLLAVFVLLLHVLSGVWRLAYYSIIGLV
ncbi:MAG TPA: CDP-alcohol phosphatidyltransferase, partial [Clostridia bacterium]|nr:CDP-alcohol phosphatidyltransferase [Clostridia bacterium]